jgi:hypothetical protein
MVQNMDHTNDQQVEALVHPNILCFQNCQRILLSMAHMEIQLQFEIYAVILLVPALGFAVFAILKIVLLSKRRSPVQF